jgi:hypothetical protein
MLNLEVLHMGHRTSEVGSGSYHSLDTGLGARRMSAKHARAPEAVHVAAVAIVDAFSSAPGMARAVVCETSV